MKRDWNKQFMGLAKHYATWSKDIKTGVGCVIVSETNNEISMGYNGFPRGANDSINERYYKPLKYAWTEHSERNAIFKAAKEGHSTDGCKMYVTYFPCHECARAIIQAGIKEIITYEPDFSHEKWGESWNIALDMFEECGVKITYYNE